MNRDDVAAGRYEVVVRERSIGRVSVRRLFLGSMVETEGFDVAVVERHTGKTALVMTTHGSRTKANGLAHVIRADAAKMTEPAFLKKYVRMGSLR